MIVTVRGADAVRRTLSNLEQRQIPYALSKSTNQVTLEARDYLKDRNRQAFIIRRPWVLNGWRVRLSNKRQTPIKATLWLDPTRDFLSKFEDGGSKQSRSGSSLAVPIGARPSPKALVPKTLLIRALQLRKHVTSTGKVQLKGLHGSFSARDGGRTWILQRISSGNSYARTRPSGRGGTKGGRDPGVRVLYSFKKSVPIPAALQFYQSVGNYVANEWPSIMGEALGEAIRTAR